jgi:hypothetical protein
MAKQRGSEGLALVGEIGARLRHLRRNLADLLRERADAAAELERGLLNILRDFRGQIILMATEVEQARQERADDRAALRGGCFESRIRLANLLLKTANFRPRRQL